MPAPYVELHSHSNFSFLDGGSHPCELAVRAAELEMPALAITDRGGVYGAVQLTSRPVASWASSRSSAPRSRSMTRS